MLVNCACVNTMLLHVGGHLPRKKLHSKHKQAFMCVCAYEEKQQHGFLFTMRDNNQSVDSNGI